MINWTVHKSLVYMHKVMRSFYFCTLLTQTLNKLRKKITMYLATSPLPIQLFHWFLFFISYQQLALTLFTQKSEFKIQFEKIVYIHKWLGRLQTKLFFSRLRSIVSSSVSNSDTCTFFYSFDFFTPQFLNFILICQNTFFPFFNSPNI